MSGGERVISYLELRPTSEAFEVWRYESPDIGDAEYTDVVEFSHNEDNEALATLQTPSEALHFAHSQLGADPQRWVNCGESPRVSWRLFGLSQTVTSTT
jgi:hypothetical protein